MKNYTIIGIDLAKTKFHIAALNAQNKVVLKQAISRNDFIKKLDSLFMPNQTFAFEACGGAHNIGQILTESGHKVIALKTKDIKAYAKTRQKNDINDAIAICKAALDPDLKQVKLKNKEEQTISYLHKTRQNVIQQRIQRSNSIMTSLQEFGFIVKCGKARFAKECEDYVLQAYDQNFISNEVQDEMLKDCKEIVLLLIREKELNKLIVSKNKASEKAQLLETIPGIGAITLAF